MRAKVQRWANSLAVRIPKAYAEDIEIEENSQIQISLADRCLVLSRARARTFTLKGLLAGVTDEALHHAIDTGPAVGNEVW
jgi:antitoxin MazE